MFCDYARLFARADCMLARGGGIVKGRLARTSCRAAISPRLFCKVFCETRRKVIDTFLIFGYFTDMNTDAIITAAFNPRLRDSRLPCLSMDGLELPASIILRPEVFFTPVNIRSLVTPGRFAALSLSCSYVRFHALAWTASSYQRVHRSDPPFVVNSPAGYLHSLVTPGRLAALSLSRSYVRFHALSWTASSYQREAGRTLRQNWNRLVTFSHSLVTPSRLRTFSQSRSSVRFHASAWTAGSYQRVHRSETSSVNTPAGFAPLAGNSQPRCGSLYSAPLPSFRLDGCGGLASSGFDIRPFLLYFARNASRSLVPHSRLRALPSFFRPFPDAGLDGLELPASLPAEPPNVLVPGLSLSLAGNSGPRCGFLYSAPLPSFRLDGCGGLASSGFDIRPFLLYFARNASRSLIPHSRLRAFSPYPSSVRFHASAWTAGSYQRAHHKPKPLYITVESISFSLVTLSRLRTFSLSRSSVRFHASVWTAGSYQRAHHKPTPPYLTVESISFSLVTSSRLRAFSPSRSSVRFHALSWTASSYQRVHRSESPSIKNLAGYLHSLVTPSRLRAAFHSASMPPHGRLGEAGELACRKPLGRFLFRLPVSPSRFNFVPLRFHTRVWTAGRGRRVSLPMPPYIIIRSDTLLLAGLSEPFQRRSRSLPSSRLDGFGLPASQSAGISMLFFTGRPPFHSLVTLGRLRKAGVGAAWHGVCDICCRRPLAEAKRVGITRRYRYILHSACKKRTAASG
jgi:hypothetical protein